MMDDYIKLNRRSISFQITSNPNVASFTLHFYASREGGTKWTTTYNSFSNDIIFVKLLKFCQLIFEIIFKVLVILRRKFLNQNSTTGLEAKHIFSAYAQIWCTCSLWTFSPLTLCIMLLRVLDTVIKNDILFWKKKRTIITVLSQ